MNLLLLNYLSLAFWSLVFKNKLSRDRKGSFLFLIVMTIQLTFVVLCSPIFSDAIVYGQHAAWNWYSGFEPGYVLFSKLVWGLWASPKALMLFTGLIFQISFAYFCWQYSDNYALSYFLMICLGFFGMSLFILRQTIALAISMFTFKYVKEERPVAFLFSILLACSFHKTAILLIVLYPVTKFNRGALFHLGSICLSLLLLILGPYLASIVISVHTNPYELTELSGVSLLVLMVGFLIFNDLGESEDVADISGYSLELASIFQVLALRFSDFTRATRYFFISATISIPAAICRTNNPNLKLLLSCFVILFGFVFNTVIDDWGVSGFVRLFEFKGFIF